jgi:hypothetical protein
MPIQKLEFDRPTDVVRVSTNDERRAMFTKVHRTYKVPPKCLTADDSEVIVVSLTVGSRCRLGGATQSTTSVETLEERRGPTV